MFIPYTSPTQLALFVTPGGPRRQRQREDQPERRRREHHHQQDEEDDEPWLGRLEGRAAPAATRAEKEISVSEHAYRRMRHSGVVPRSMALLMRAAWPMKSRMMASVMLVT